MEPCAAGARFFTVTWNCWLAVRLPGSAAVTVIVAAPFARGVTDTVLPAVLTVATVSFEERAW